MVFGWRRDVNVLTAFGAYQTATAPSMFQPAKW